MCQSARPRTPYASTHSFALERFPQNSSVENREFRNAGTRSHLARANVVDVHNADDIVFAIARPLHVFVQFSLQEIIDVVSQEGRVQRNLAL